MKKKILSLVLAMTLVLAYAVPVAAAEAEIPATETVVAEETLALDAGSEKVSDDPAVQKAYDAYLALEKAMADGDLAAVKEAHKSLEGLDFETDAQQEEFDSIIEEKVGTIEYLVTVFSAAYVIDASDKYDAYQTAKNVKTAYDFVTAVDTVAEDYKIDMEKFIPGITAAYEEAITTYMPSENVVKVYEAYETLMFEYEWGVDTEEFEAAFDAFEELVDVYYEFSDEEMEELAALMEVEDGETAFYTILGDRATVNAEVTLYTYAEAFEENKTAENAQAYVEYYDSVVEYEFLTEEELEEAGYKAIYDEAITYLEAETDTEGTTGESYAEPEPEEGTTGEAVAEPEPAVDPELDEVVTEPEAAEPVETEKTTAPAEPADKVDAAVATGDDFNAAPYAALMVIAAAVAGLAVRRKVQ